MGFDEQNMPYHIPCGPHSMCFECRQALFEDQFCTLCDQDLNAQSLADFPLDSLKYDLISGKVKISSDHKKPQATLKCGEHPSEEL